MFISQLTLARLIHKAKTSPEAFVKLYSLHFDATYRYFLIRCKNQTDAEDLTAQVWEIVLKNISKLQSNHPIIFRAWLFKIVKNIFYKYLQHSSEKTVALDECINVLVAREKDPSESALLQDEVKQIHVLIDTLPDQQKEVILMRFSADLKNKEIAKILDIDEKTVASNLSRALATLRKNYKKLQ